jgi:perosamine synthetase
MIASATSVALTGATPILVDIDPATLCLDLDLVERAITPRTRAVMVVSVNGRAPDMESARSLAQQHEIELVEDAAQSLGSSWRGRHLGTFGACGTFSFSIHKLVSTGNGGAVVTQDLQLCERMRRIKDFGRPRAGVDVHEMLGFNFKFTDLQAVIGLEQMKRLGDRAARKKRIFCRYRSELADLDGMEFISTDLAQTAPWFMDILVPASARATLAAFLKQRGIGTRPFYPAIHTQAPFIHLQGEFPHALEVSRRGLWLPSSPRLSDDDIDYVCAEIRDFFLAHRA